MTYAMHLPSYNKDLLREEFRRQHNSGGIETDQPMYVQMCFLCGALASNISAAQFLVEYGVRNESMSDDVSDTARCEANCISSAKSLVSALVGVGRFFDCRVNIRWFCHLQIKVR